MPPSPTDSPLCPLMRRVLYAASALVFGVGLPLLLAPAYTDVYFPFRIDPPLTAGFLGACYCAAGVLELLSARARTWGGARVALPGVFVFTVLTCESTWRNLTHFDGPRAIVFLWTGVYTLTPLLLALAWWRQSRAGAPAPDAATGPTTPAWARALFFLLGALLVVVGLVARRAPERLADAWAWSLSSPTSYAGAATMEPYVGAWLIGLGLVAGAVAATRPVQHSRAALVAVLVLAGLMLLVMARDADDVHWAAPHAAGVLGVLLLFVIAAALCLRAARAPA